MHRLTSHITDYFSDLSDFRKPFEPPTSATPLIVRSIDYVGEEHPATAKRVVVVPVSQLPLQGDDAIHKIKLLAGTRWTPDPPSDSGVGPNEPDREHGYIKIACEDFQNPETNLSWASGALSRLIAAANVSATIGLSAWFFSLTSQRIPQLTLKTYHLI